MSDSKLEKILIIDDNSDYRKLIKTFINKLLPSIEVIEYDPVFEGIPDENFNWSEIDVLLLDYHLSIVGTTGLDLLHKHHKKYSFPATIMLTGAGTEEIAIRALGLGIYEYQPKQSLTKDKLKQSIIHAWEEKKSARKKKQEITQHNRSFSKEIFYENLEKAFAHKETERALVIIKPDDIDTLEEQIGIIGRDNLVNYIAKNSFEVFKLGACNPNITRISDSKIGVQIDYPSNQETLDFNMQGLSKHLSKCTFKFSEEKYKFSVSIGVLKLGMFNESAERLIHIASAACERANKTEGNSHYIWKETDVVPKFIEEDSVNLEQTSINEKDLAAIKEKEKLELELKATTEAKEKAESTILAEQEAKKTLETRLKIAEEAKEKAEAELKLADEAKIRAEQKAEEEAAQAELRAAQEAKQKAEAELKAQEEAKAKLQAEAEMKAAKEEKEKLEAELKAKEDAKAQAELRAEQKAEAELKAQEEAKSKLQAEAEMKTAKEEKEKLEAELKAFAEAKRIAETELKVAKEEKEKLEAQLKAITEAKEKAEVKPQEMIGQANSNLKLQNKEIEGQPVPSQSDTDKKHEENQKLNNIETQESDSKDIETSGASLKDVEAQIRKLIDEKRIIQTYQPVTAMFSDEGEVKDIYKTGLLAIPEIEEFNKNLLDTSIFSISLQQIINEWILRQVFLRITESGTTKCQYMFMITVTESWFADIALFQWLQKILSQTKKYNPGKSIILDVPLDIFNKHKKRAEALISTLHKSHQFTIALSNIHSVGNIVDYCLSTSSSLLLVDTEQLKKLTGTLAPHNEQETNDDGEEAEKQNLLQYLKSKKIRIITSGIEDSTLLTDAITAGTDYTIGSFVGDIQDNLFESSTVESFELT